MNTQCFVTGIFLSLSQFLNNNSDTLHYNFVSTVDHNFVTMTAATFCMPSPPEEIDDILGEIWRESNVSHLIYVKRVSSRGNPYVRGLLISDAELIPLPSDFEVNCLSEDCIDSTYNKFKGEIANQNNGVEYF